MLNVRLIRHEAVKDCGSYEVRVAEGRSRYFYWDDQPSGRLWPEQLTRAEALAMATALARGLSASMVIRCSRPIVN